MVMTYVSRMMVAMMGMVNIRMEEMAIVQECGFVRLALITFVIIEVYRCQIQDCTEHAHLLTYLRLPVYQRERSCHHGPRCWCPEGWPGARIRFGVC